MTRKIALLSVLSAVLALAAWPRAALASKADAFENKIKPVSGHLFLKSNRLEITPTADFSMNDAFYNKYLFGAKLNWHFSEALTLGAAIAGGFSSPSGSAVVCPAGSGCKQASPAQLYQVPGDIKMIAGAEVGFSPVYGKLNIFAEKVLHFDLSLLGGVDDISYQSILDTPDAQAAAAANSAPSSTSTVGGHVGVGVRFFLNDFITVRAELKDYVYSATIHQLGGSTSGDVINQLFAELGVSFFFPMHFSTAND